MSVPSGSVIGQVSRMSSCQGKHPFEWTWTIEDIFAHTVEGTCYFSPNFSIQDSEWHMEIYPNGETDHYSDGWISLYLERTGDKTSPKCVNFRFGVKKVCGAVEQMGEDFSWVFDDNSYVYGCPKFLKRSELLKRKSELTSSDALTLTCSLAVIDNSFDSTTSQPDTLLKNFAELLISKRGCDVTLKVQDREFPVHKCILSARSSVFCAMFEAEMKEKETGVVDIVDCDPEAFEDFLTFLYSAAFQKDKDIHKVIELYKIADKYCVADLKSVCTFYMMSHLTAENVCDVAVLGDQLDDNSLIEKTRIFFNRNFGKIVNTDGWMSLLKSDVRLVNWLLREMALENNL